MTIRPTSRPTAGQTRRRERKYATTGTKVKGSDLSRSPFCRVWCAELVDLSIVGVDHVLFLFLLSSLRSAVRRGAGRRRAGLLVDVLSDLLQGLVELVHLAAQ